MDVESSIAFAGSLILGLTAGFFMHRSDYCLAGAFRDYFLCGSIGRLGSLVLLVTVSGLLFETFRLLQWLPGYPFPCFAPPSASNFVGGALFGIGMVLAGGCVVGVLYKFGGGSLLAGIALLGLICGSALYAEFHATWVRLAAPLRFPTEAVTLPQLVGTAPSGWVAVVACGGGVVSWAWWRRYRQNPGHQAEGYIPLWGTAVVLACLGLASVLITSIPLGVTTSYAKLAALLESLVVPDHVANTAFFTAQPIHLTLPIGSREMAGGGGPSWDVVAIVQYPLVLGIILGAMLSAKLLGELKLYAQLPSRQVGIVFCGAVVMAFGSRMTPGCNVWHLLGGLPILAMQSLLFLAGMVPGAWLGTMIMRRILV